MLNAACHPQGDASAVEILRGSADAVHTRGGFFEWHILAHQFARRAQQPLSTVHKTGRRLVARWSLNAQGKQRNGQDQRKADEDIGHHKRNF